MMTVFLDKNVTIMKDLSQGKSFIQTLRYKDLESKLSNESEIIADYPFGSMKKRVSQLTKLGYKLKETIWFNDDALYSRIKEVWAK